MAWYLYVLVALAGTAAGFVNILAGNGSLITLSVLIFVGLPPNIANATNRVAVLLENIVGVTSFDRKALLDRRGALVLSIPMVLGSILGASLAVEIDQTLFKRLLAIVMILMLAIMLANPKRWLVQKAIGVSNRLSWIRFLLFFATGAYGGFMQAGVGILLLAGLVLSVGYDIVRANAVKSAIVLASAVVSLIVFAASLKVDWGIGIVLGIGNMLGAWLATRFAVEKGVVWVRRIVIVVILLSAAQLLGAFCWLGTLIERL